jgi:hypothetical protein
VRSWTSEKVFQEFSPVLEQKKGAGKDKNERLQYLIRSTILGREPDPDDFDTILEVPDEEQPLQNIRWDERWLDAAIKADQLLAVYFLARPGHKGATNYVLKQIDPKSRYQAGAIEALARCQYPKLTDAFLELVAKRTKATKQLDYDLQSLFRTARFLPSADLPKLDAFAAKLDEKFVDNFLEALAPLRTKSAVPA